VYSHRVVNWLLKKEMFVHCLLGEFTETSFKVLEVIWAVRGVLAPFFSIVKERNKMDGVMLQTFSMLHCEMQHFFFYSSITKGWFLFNYFAQMVELYFCVFSK